MDIRMNTTIECTDGHAGHLMAAIVDPEHETLTHIVVKSGSKAHLVPVSHIQDARSEQVKLNLKRQALNDLPEFFVTEYVEVPVEHRGYTLDGMFDIPYDTMETFAVKHEHVPDGEQAIKRGMKVFASDGRIGRVDDLMVHPETSQITHLVLREGHLWGQKDVVIDVSHIKTIDADGIHLKVARAELDDSPVIPVKH